MKANRSFPQGCVFGLVSILLGICLTVFSARYQRRYYPVCQGGLSAGFPIAFICDSSGASGTPASSWGRIDFADWVNINPIAFLLEVLLYSALSSLTWLTVVGLSYGGFSNADSFRWGVLICLGYLAVFLFVFLSFQTNSLNIEPSFPRTPMPIISSPTPFGTPPPPAFSPIPTSRTP